MNLKKMAGKLGKTCLMLDNILIFQVMLTDTTPEV